MTNDFKIIAIEPLKGCFQKHLKVLKRKTLYYFQNDYTIKDNKVYYTPTIPNFLFSNKEDDLKINVSAVVGKNGSGKSTIIELLLMAINNFSFGLSIYDKFIKTVALEPVTGLNVAVYYKTDKYYKLIIERNKISIINLEEDDSEQTRVLHLIYQSKNSKSTTNFNSKTNGSYLKQIFNLSQFFYTIGTNYSHYALNSNHYGGWIENIFHKNDSYQAPIVVNPFRKEGNIDINKETYLVKSRLLAYLLSGDKEHLQLTDKQKAFKANFKLNQAKFKNAYSFEVFKPKYSKNEIAFDKFFIKNDKQFIVDSVYSAFKINNKPSFYKEEIELYIIRKLISIARTYDDYLKYFNNSEGAFYYDNKNENNFTSYLKQIVNNKSHVTFKLRQAINYIKNNPFEKLEFTNDELSVTFESLSQVILSKCKVEDIINNIPPPIFDFDIEFEIEEEDTYDKNDEPPTFNALSSGEKQSIYTTYSVLYHIFNINSVESSLHQYRNINLIFEEIELYFHPEMQRRWVQYLLNQIKKQNFNNIKSINICFITHSPFILSDIPSTNILFLKENGKPLEKELIPNTFASNIHGLLANSFFMANGVIGAHAKDLIEQLIAYLKENKFDSKFNIDSSLELINSVSDEIIKSRLMDMYNIKFRETRKLKELRKIQLEKELEQVTKELSND